MLRLMPPPGVGVTVAWSHRLTAPAGHRGRVHSLHGLYQTSPYRPTISGRPLGCTRRALYVFPRSGPGAPWPGAPEIAHPWREAAARGTIQPCGPLTAARWGLPYLICSASPGLRLLHAPLDYPILCQLVNANLAIMGAISCIYPQSVEIVP